MTRMAFAVGWRWDSPRPDRVGGRQRRVGSRVGSGPCNSVEVSNESYHQLVALAFVASLLFRDRYPFLAFFCFSLSVFNPSRRETGRGRGAKDVVDLVDNAMVGPLCQTRFQLQVANGTGDISGSATVMSVEGREAGEVYKRRRRLYWPTSRVVSQVCLGGKECCKVQSARADKTGHGQYFRRSYSIKERTTGRLRFAVLSYFARLRLFIPQAGASDDQDNGKGQSSRTGKASMQSKSQKGQNLSALR